jgi:uncharacterized protein involved in exopolysaccharide biosynthesis
VSGYEDSTSRTDAYESRSQRGVELTPMGLLRLIHRRRNLVLALTIGLPVATAVVTLFMPNQFKATGTILLETASAPSGLEMLGQLGALAGLPTTAPTADTYLAVLGSRRVRAAVAESLSLADHYRIHAPTEAQRMEKTLSALSRRVKLETPDVATIRIQANDTDPEVAASIVNSLLDQLVHANQTLSLTRAQRTRKMVEEALAQTGTDLEAARRRMADFQRRYGVFSLDDQTSGTLKLITDLQQQLVEAHTRRDALGAVYREGSAEYRQLDHVIAGLESRIAGLVGQFGPPADSSEAAPVTPAEGQQVGQAGEGERSRRAGEGERSGQGGEGEWSGQGGQNEKEGFILPLGKIPDLSGEYARVLTDLKVLEMKYTVLATKLEQTKVDESQSMPSFEVLDRAVRPFRKSGPNRSLFVLSALLGGLLAGILLAVLLEDLSRHLTPEVRRELAEMLPDRLRGRVLPSSDNGA